MTLGPTWMLGEPTKPKQVQRGRGGVCNCKITYATGMKPPYEKEKSFCLNLGCQQMFKLTINYFHLLTIMIFWAVFCIWVDTQFGYDLLSRTRKLVTLLSCSPLLLHSPEPNATVLVLHCHCVARCKTMGPSLSQINNHCLNVIKPNKLICNFKEGNRILREVLFCELLAYRDCLKSSSHFLYFI